MHIVTNDDSFPTKLHIRFLGAGFSPQAEENIKLLHVKAAPRIAVEGRSPIINHWVPERAMASSSISTGPCQSDRTHLLNLPRELRNEIYDYLSPGLKESDRTIFGSSKESCADESTDYYPEEEPPDEVASAEESRTNNPRTHRIHRLTKTKIQIDRDATMTISAIANNPHPSLLTVCSQLHQEYSEHLERRAVMRILHDAPLGMFGLGVSKLERRRAVKSIRRAVDALVRAHPFVASCRKWWFLFSVYGADAYMSELVDGILERAPLLGSVEVVVDYFFHHDSIEDIIVWSHSLRTGASVPRDRPAAYQELLGYGGGASEGGGRRVSKYIWLLSGRRERYLCGEGKRARDVYPWWDVCERYLGIQERVVFMVADHATYYRYADKIEVLH